MVVTEVTEDFTEAAVAEATVVMVVILAEAVVAMELPLMERAAVGMVSTIMGMVETQTEQELLVSA